MMTAGTPADDRLRVSASSAAPSDARTASDTSRIPDPLPALGHDRSFARCVRIHWKEVARGNKRLELLRLPGDSGGAEVGDFSPSQHLPPCAVGQRLFGSEMPHR